MKKVRAKKDITLSNGFPVASGTTTYVPDTEATYLEGRGEAEILLIPENRETK